ncbi:MAG: hypothetical protein JSV43_06715 [Methanobacteriota archaeon]|nr:MAG: hypothetical protein JSV43_06715 [Euryarchaeota archaeon]
MSHMLPEVQNIIDYEFLNQDLDIPVKLDILFYELDRVEKTLEVKGNPYVFLDPDEAEISTENGRVKFQRHEEWIREKLSETEVASSVPDGSDSLDELYNFIIDTLWREDIHAMIILTLAQIVIVQGLDQYCQPNN